MASYENTATNGKSIQMPVLWGFINVFIALRQMWAETEVVRMTEPVSRCCKNCETRSVNCHATCEKYLAYRKMRNKINAARQKEKIKDTLEMQRLQKAKDVMLAKKQRGMR